MLAVAILLVVSPPSILAGNPVDKAWSTLTEAIENKSSDQRREGIQALGSLRGDRKANALVEKALSDVDPSVRAAAATAIGQMHDLTARSLLRKELNDKNIKVVLASAGALYIFKDPAADEVYYAVLTGERKSHEGIVQSQLEALHDRKQVEKLAFETGIGFVPYAGIGWDVWQRLTEDHGSSVRAAAAENLATDPDPKSAKALMDASDDNDWRVRAAVANAIGRRHDPKLLNTVSSMLLDPNLSVRLQAAASVIALERRKQAQ